MTDNWDRDIAEMPLSAVEKNGMQFYRNFSTAIDARRIRDCVAALDTASPPIDDLKKALVLVVEEEPLPVTVVACAFADDQLKEMFRREIPSSVPGGRNELLNGFGPLSRLSQRIQVAYAFNWLSADLLVELDLLRRVRNDISHKWDMTLLHTKLGDFIEGRQHPIEEYLDDGVRLPTGFYQSLSPISRFRVRVIWLVGRLFYECHLFVSVLKQRLDPFKVLYTASPPQLLSHVASACVEHTQLIITQEARTSTREMTNSSGDKLR